MNWVEEAAAYWVKLEVEAKREEEKRTERGQEEEKKRGDEDSIWKEVKEGESQMMEENVDGRRKRDAKKIVEDSLAKQGRCRQQLLHLSSLSSLSLSWSTYIKSISELLVPGTRIEFRVLRLSRLFPRRRHDRHQRHHYHHHHR